MLFDGEKILTVAELTQEVKTLIEEGFASVWVSGEVSNLARPGSGHLYLVLKDGQAQLRAVIWRGIALRLVIEELHPKGIGARELALQQLLQRLFGQGYFDPKRKKPLPRFPRRVALVT